MKGGRGEQQREAGAGFVESSALFGAWLPPEKGRHQRVVAAEPCAQIAELDVRAFDPVLGERSREIPAPEQRAMPVRRFLGIAVRRRVAKRRVAQALQILDERRRGVGLRIGGAQRGRRRSGTAA